VRPGVSVTRWPSYYLTDEVRLWLALADLKRDGILPLSDPAVLWPAPLVQAMRAIEGERRLRGDHG
jgi:hypothetical protein